MAARNSGQANKAPARKVSQPKGKARPAYAAPNADKPPLLDERARRDIGAVVLAILAVALGAIALLSPTGLVTGVISSALRFGVGVGAYVLPCILIAIALSIVVRFDNERLPARVSIGLALIFLAVLVLVSLATPGAETNPNRLFIQQYLVVHGGYIGGGIAWALLTLFGMTVSLILMFGLIVIAFVVIGFSFSRMFDKIRARRAEAASAKEAAEAKGEGDAFSHLPRTPLARVRRAPGQAPNGNPANALANAPTQAIEADKPLDQAATQLLGNASPAKRRTRHADDTVMLGSTSSPQMTRKLGGRTEADAAEGSPKKAEKPARKAQSTATPEPQDGFELPGMELLRTSASKRHSAESEATLRSTSALLQETLADFGVNATVVDWVAGPTVTLFKIDLPSGVRVSRVSNLSDDVALALASPGVRIFAPVPGTNYVGIEVPNKKRETVLLGDVLKGAPAGPLQVAIGKDVEGRNIVSDLARMPHLLIGGTTGSGKSVAINGMIMSILMRATPAEVRFIMIDPKRVEFTPYNDIPHLYVPVVTEAREAASALAWAVAEMERRLKVFSGIGARNIGQYNAKCQQGLMINEAPADEMPYIVIVIDELADLMMNVGKEVEFSISRLAQLARAAGIHLIVATQRPSTNVVTGLIKANITNRIAFNVASGIDSRVILDTPGAENLIGLGDLLLSKPELAKPQRIQGCFVSEEEIAAVVEKLKAQGDPEYHNDILKTNLITLGDSAPDGSGGSASGADDPLVWEAAEIVVSSGLGSTSNLQRRLSVGYSRAGRIMDLLEEKGIVGPPNGSKPREVLVSDALELETIKAFDQNDDD